MSTDIWHDRMIHVLLDAELGGDEAPDVKKDVRLALLRRHSVSFRAARWVALAASIAVLAGGAAWLTWHWRASNAIEATGEFVVTEGDSLRGGSTVRTSTGPAEFRLGEHACISAGPNTELRFQGSPKHEVLFLQEGEVQCSVRRGQGTMVVETEIGSVWVVGTRFRVALKEETGNMEGTVMRKQMIVSVISGTVLVAGSWGKHEVHAGEQLRADARSVVRTTAAQPDEMNPAVAAHGEMERIAREGQSVFRAAKELRKQGKEKEARAMFLKAADKWQKVYETDPSGALGSKAGVLAGQSRILAKDWRGATALFETIIATKNTPDSIKAEAMYWCGDAYARLSETDEGGRAAFAKAETIWKKLTWAYPESKWAKYARARLGQPAVDRGAARDPNRTDSSPRKITASFNSVSAAQALKMLSSLTGKSIRIEGDLPNQPLVTMSLKDVSAEEAIRSIAGAAGLEMSVIDGSFVVRAE